MIVEENTRLWRAGENLSMCDAIFLTDCLDNGIVCSRAASIKPLLKCDDLTCSVPEVG